MNLTGALLLAVAVESAGAQEIRVIVQAPLPSARSEARELMFSAPRDAVVGGRVLLRNIGGQGGALHWQASASATSCANPVPAPWLSVEPGIGVTADGRSSDLSIYASSFAAHTETRRAVLCIHSDAISEPLVELPVRLTITPSQ